MWRRGGRVDGGGSEGRVGGGVGAGELSHQKPREHESSPPHLVHIIAAQIFQTSFFILQTIGPFDLWSRIKSFAAEKLQMKR